MGKATHLGLGTARPGLTSVLFPLAVEGVAVGALEAFAPEKLDVPMCEITLALCAAAALGDEPRSCLTRQCGRDAAVRLPGTGRMASWRRGSPRLLLCQGEPRTGLHPVDALILLGPEVGAAADPNSIPQFQLIEPSPFSRSR